MINLIKIILGIVALFVVVFVLFLGYIIITDYKPDAIENIEVSNNREKILERVFGNYI